MTCCRISKKVAKISVCIALVLLIVSVVLLIMFPTIYNTILNKKIALTEGSVITNAWKDFPLPVNEKLYFFNITNKEQFLAGSEPLNVSEVGPYTYDGKWVKDYLVWNPNDTVSYRETRTYHFVPHMSIGTEDDEVYTLNGPLIIAAKMAESVNEDLRAILSIVLGTEGEGVVIKRKIRELVYEGYEDFIIKYAKLVKSDIPYDKGIFSWLYGKNATNDGLFNVYTGADDVSKINIMDRWNGEDRLNFWKGDSCNMMNGTSIETSKPGRDTFETYSFFQSIFCRTLTFKETEETEHFGVKAKRFVSTYSLFANSTENPDNYCYEVQGERPSGVLDVSPCQFGSPVFLSFPHFLFSDPVYLDAVSGLSPNERRHGSHVDVELVTGLSIDLAMRFQVNLELTKVTGIFQTYSPSKGVLPVFWAEVTMQLTEDLADFLTGQVQNPKTISYAVLGVIMILSATVVVFGFYNLCSRSEEDVPLLGAIKEEYSEYCGNDVSPSVNREAHNAKNDREKLTGSSEYKENNVSGNKSDDSLVKA